MTVHLRSSHPVPVNLSKELPRVTSRRVESKARSKANPTPKSINNILRATTATSSVILVANDTGMSSPPPLEANGINPPVLISTTDSTPSVVVHAAVPNTKRYSSCGHLDHFLRTNKRCPLYQKRDIKALDISKEEPLRSEKCQASPTS